LRGGEEEKKDERPLEGGGQREGSLPSKGGEEKKGGLLRLRRKREKRGCQDLYGKEKDANHIFDAAEKEGLILRGRNNFPKIGRGKKSDAFMEGKNGECG